jgi:probable HAF family extracellular repeat protein
MNHLKHVNKVWIVALSVLLFSGFAFAQVAFSVVAVPGSSPNSPIAVNNAGQVMVNTGTSISAQVSLWSSASGAQSMNLVGTNSAGASINNSGDVVGTGDPNNTGYLQAFKWQTVGGEQWLGSLGGNFSAASGVNDAGAVAGMSLNAANYQHAFLWTQAGGMVDLTPNLTSIGGATAVAVNSSNQVVGYYFPNGSGNTLGFTWTQAGGLVNLGAAGTLALDVNDAGTVVGQWPSATGNSHGFSWTQSGGIQDLGSLGGESAALSINSQGWIVGNYLISTGKGLLHGFLWTATAGMQDFTTLAGLIASEQISSAQVNDLGMIAISTNKGGFLLLPKVTGRFASSGSPSVAGQPVTFTATLSSIAGPPPDGETVTFLTGTTVLGSATTAGGVAEFTTSALKAGSHGITVEYPGDVSHPPAKFAALTQVVSK